MVFRVLKPFVRQILKGIVISGQGTQTTTKPEFKAIISDRGTIESFTQISGGSGYSIPPTVTVDDPIEASDATAQAHINAATGRVEFIDVVDSGNRYFVPPKVVVYPPNPRGEGVAATAVAVLDESGKVKNIIVTSGGIGYVSPPQVIVEPRFDFARTENLDIAADISADKYELYLSRNEWTERERGRLLVRPQAAIAEGTSPATNVFIEASVSDVFVEGAIETKTLSGFMQSKPGQDMFAPFTVSTRSSATNEHSGTIKIGHSICKWSENTNPSTAGSALLYVG